MNYYYYRLPSTEDTRGCWICDCLLFAVVQIIKIILTGTISPTQGRSQPFPSAGASSRQASHFLPNFPFCPPFFLIFSVFVADFSKFQNCPHAPSGYGPAPTESALYHDVLCILIFGHHCISNHRTKPSSTKQ